MNTKIINVILMLIIAIMLLERRGAELKIEEQEEHIVVMTEGLSMSQADLFSTLNRVEELEQELDRVNKELDKFTGDMQYNRAAVPVYELPLSEDLQVYTYDKCRYYNIEEYYELVLAVMWHESRFDAAALSSTDDYGIMQINKCNHEDLREVLGIVDFLDAEENIEAGIYILSNLLRKYEDPHKALMAYNMGPTGAAESWAKGNYTSNYSRAIMTKAELVQNNNFSEDI